MTRQRTVWLSLAAVVGAIGVALLAIFAVGALTTPHQEGPVTSSQHPSPSPSDPSEPPVEETITVEVTGRITALSSGSDDGVFHLTVNGHGLLPILIPEGLEFSTEKDSTVTVEVPASLDVSGSIGARFAALEGYAQSIRGPLTVVAVAP